jgi:RNA polymerase sigma-70 factor (ECF subfamily)
MQPAEIFFARASKCRTAAVVHSCKGKDMTGNGTVTTGKRDSVLFEQERELQLAAALARCGAGDRTALQAIYDSEASRMIGVARRILFRKDLAEEAVHDAFIRIWRGAVGFDPRRGSARGWLYAVVRHRALSIHRNEHRYETSDESPEHIDCVAILSLIPETSALRRCLEQIDRPRRDVVVLAYVHGMSHGELAGKLRVPLGTVKSWVRRSLLALQECMG